jgi:hypothetical protein
VETEAVRSALEAAIADPVFDAPEGRS